MSASKAATRQKGPAKKADATAKKGLTGWEGPSLAGAIEQKVDLESFYATAPCMNPNVGLITGVVCGVRVEEVADPVMRKIRMLDKLVDELAKGKKMASILRQPASG